MINHHMQRTFALRRQEIVQSSLPIEDFKSRWPALFLEAQVYAEFHRITNQNLPQTFFSSLNKYTPQLLSLYKTKAGKSGATADKMAAILNDYEEKVSNV
ncbi:hypothetical protein SKAU_G00403610 [Synaphobranchus kaupii]|uniref:Uncharacterized protein n=1 Tax=Synaphobranchus kaupii TaxID=118154 RepID=A0A9Q1E9I8_SYNKA|nr:hypothetical protein SKAU_G00403610 [Synaphobranchus kaupii]